jgi:hypothetical protein
MANSNPSPQTRFTKGNTHSSAPKNARLHAEYRKALLDATTKDQVIAVGQELYELAIQGDVAAAKTWLEHIIGKAPQSIEHTGAEGEPLDRDAGRLEIAVVNALAGHPEARIALALELKEDVR